jgi:predicted transcriptional regulator
MQRAQIYLSESHLGRLAACARARKTTQSALIREALDEYLLRQNPVDKRALRERAFAAWADNPTAPTLAQLRSEERSL